MEEESIQTEALSPEDADALAIRIEAEFASVQAPVVLLIPMNNGNVLCASKVTPEGIVRILTLSITGYIRSTDSLSERRSMLEWIARVLGQAMLSPVAIPDENKH